MSRLKIASFFSGAGGLDIGFSQAGFDVVWANEFDKKIWKTFEYNFKHIYLSRKDINLVKVLDIPDVDGFIGGPPCQSWSEAGSRRGACDPRGQVFFSYLNLIKLKKPSFFVIENVAGLLHKKFAGVFEYFVKFLENCGYDVYWKLLNAFDYGVAQTRKRVFIVGFLKKLNVAYEFPCSLDKHIVLKDVIWDLQKSAVPASIKNRHSEEVVLGNEYFVGGFSPQYMSRNRVRSWDEPSFTIQASGRHAPLHPSAPFMERVGRDNFEFKQGFEKLYRRLSVRECARIQGFSDDYNFIYDRVDDGYKMIGNAVPVNLAYCVAMNVRKALDFRFKKTY